MRTPSVSLLHGRPAFDILSMFPPEFGEESAFVFLGLLTCAVERCTNNTLLTFLASSFRSKVRVPQKEVAAKFGVHIALCPTGFLIARADGSCTKPELATVIRTRFIDCPCTTGFLV